MSYDIGPKIGVDGEAEFRSALKNINTSLKTLGTEMGAVTSSFGKNQKSEEALTEKNKVLNKEIDAQKEKLSKLKEGLAASTEKYGENDEKTQKWQQAVNKAQETLNKQNNELDENEKSLSNVKNGVNDTADAEEDASKKTSTFGDVLKANLASDAIKNGIQAIANAIKSIGSKLKDAVVGGTSFADNIMTLSTQTGIGTKKLQEYQYMAELTDTSLETITGSMSKLTKNMLTASGGSGSAATALKALGVEITNADGSLRNNQDVFGDALDALGKMDNTTQRDAYSMAIFGKSAQDLNPLIAAGSDGVKKFAKEAEDMGYVLDDKTLASLGKADDAFRRFDNMTTVVKNRIAVALAPVITDISDKMMKWAKSVDWDALSQKVQNAVQKIWTSLKKIDFKGLADKAKSALNRIKNGFDKLSESKVKIEKIMQAFKVLIPVILAAKVATDGYRTACALGGIATAAKKAITGIVTALTAQTTATGATTIAQRLLNVVMKANPFGLVVVAITAVVTALVALYQHNEKFRKQVDKIGDFLKKFGSSLAGGAKKLFTQTIPSAMGSMVGEFGKIPGKMADIGKNIVKGIWTGISSSLTWIKNKISGWVGNVVDFFKKILGIHSPSTVFAGLGGYMAQGVGVGFDKNIGAVKDSIANQMTFAAGTVSVNTAAKTQQQNAQTQTIGNMLSGTVNAIGGMISGGTAQPATIVLQTRDGHNLAKWLLPDIRNVSKSSPEVVSDSL